MFLAFVIWLLRFLVLQLIDFLLSKHENTLLGYVK